MNASSSTLVVRHASGNEARELHILRRAGGGAHIVQLSSGMLTRLAYGEKAVCQRLSLDARELARLSAALGWQDGAHEGAARFFARGDAMLADLLDVCNRAGIAFRFCTIIGNEGVFSISASAGEPTARGSTQPPLNQQARSSGRSPSLTPGPRA